MDKKSVEASQGGIDDGLKREGLRLWRLCDLMDRMMEEWSMDGIKVKEIRIQGPEQTGGGYRAVIKAASDAGPGFYAIRSGSSVREVMLKIETDITNGTLQLREDKPWSPPTQGATGQVTGG